MSLFDELVDEALNNKQELAPLRVVVEKELLHHDILRVLSGAGLLTQLTFIGGTCLRACYGSSRLSEDLDFTGGADFTRDQLAAMSNILIESLKAKYGLEINVTDPVREEGNVDTWKLKVQTRPGRKDIPAQRINIVDDIAYPGKTPKHLTQGESFFTLMRNLTATGFYTSKIGIADLEYQGNTPNQWNGVPDEVLKQYGLSYDA